MTKIENNPKNRHVKLMLVLTVLSALVLGNIYLIVKDEKSSKRAQNFLIKTWKYLDSLDDVKVESKSTENTSSANNGSVVIYNNSPKGSQESTSSVKVIIRESVQLKRDEDSGDDDFDIDEFHREFEETSQRIEESNKKVQETFDKFCKDNPDSPACDF